jgi:hypothetical protein
LLRGASDYKTMAACKGDSELWKGEPMTDADRKLLTLKMGEEWHELLTDSDFPPICSCGNPFSKADHHNRTFTNWTDFGAVWNWAKGQEWWEDFVRYSRGVGDLLTDGCHDAVCRILIILVRPDSFPALIVQFGKMRLGWREE